MIMECCRRERRVVVAGEEKLRKGEAQYRERNAGHGGELMEGEKRD